MMPTVSKLTYPLVACAALLCGCQQDEIQHYRVPKPPAPVAKTAGGAGEQRMLAAILPRGEKSWFVKLVGPPDVVAAHAQAFERFIRSLRFTKDAAKPLAWTVPEGWREEPGQGEFRYATLRVAPELEATVSSAGGSLLDNVNRWRGQIGLKPVGDAELAKLAKAVPAEGIEAKLFDMTGTGGNDTMKMPPFARAKAPRVPPQARPGIKYQTPEGWTAAAKPGAMSVATLQVSAGGQTADVTVTPLSGDAGGLLNNVNRWRGQVGLNPVDEPQLAKEMQKLDVAGTTAPYFDLSGPRGQRILIAVVPRGDTTWFIKMTGPTELVGKQKAAFEAFIRSLRFEAGPGANDG